MASSFGHSGQGQQQQPYMAAQFADYGHQGRYAGGSHAGYGMLPYGQQYLPQAPLGPAPDGAYDADSLAFAQGIQNNMVLGHGQQQQMMQGQYYAPQQPRMPGYGYGYPPQAGPSHAAAMRGQPQLGQQQFQQPPQQAMAALGPMDGGHPMDMRGPMQNGRGGPRPGNGMHRGMGPHRQQQQRGGGGGRKKVQTGLEDNVRRTVYISYIDQSVTEESLATFFAGCGTVMDCRICGDPNSAMRFAFIEFMEDKGAQEALKMTGSTLGKSSLRVLPSKTAIVPVNKELMPRSEEELERCSRTVYVANIDKKVDREEVRLFFEKLCGRIGKIRLLGDTQHSTRIAFIEFVDAESAMTALNCSGALLGALPLRVSPSKTPVRGDKDDRESRQKGQRGNKNQQQQQPLQPPPGMEAEGSLQSPQGSGAVPADGSAASVLNSSDSGVVEGPAGRASSGTSTQDDTAAQAALEIAQQMQQQLQIDAPGADAAAEEGSAAAPPP